MRNSNPYFEIVNQNPIEKKSRGLMCVEQIIRTVQVDSIGQKYEAIFIAGENGFYNTTKISGR